MAWYKTGTIDVTNGSTSVIGASTEFVLNVKIGEALVAPNGELYEITGIVSNTQLTIAKPYDGATAINQTFEIVPTQSFIRDLAGQASQLLATIGQGKIGDGTAIDPGLKFANDLDTGIFRTGENAFGFSAGGVNVLDITQSGIQFQDINIAGNTVIGGNLTVQGTSTTLNTQELNVEDKNITVAFGAVDAVSANGAGLTVDGANATFTYTLTGDKWNLNKPLDVVGNVNAPSFSIDTQPITSSAIELNLLDGANVTTTEINHLVGVTSGIQGQLNLKAETLIDLGVTASIAEVNTLDGITATTAELNHTDGVTSNIQTQLNAKAPTANPTFTGTATIPNVDINGGTVNPTTLTENGFAAVVQSDIGTAPNEVPLNQYLGNLAFQSSDAVVLNPVALAVPSGIGDMVFQLTNDTTLLVKVKGSDGTIRSTTLTLA